MAFLIAGKILRSAEVMFEVAESVFIDEKQYVEKYSCE